MNLKDSLNNIVNAEMTQEEKSATYEEVHQICQEAMNKIKTK
jgi:hypothetical protein